MMKQLWAIFLTAILCFGFPMTAWAQKSEGQLTIQEMREAKRLLAIFERRLAETHDVELASQAIGAPDWFENILRQARKSDTSELEAIGFSQILFLNYPQEYRRAWLAFHNLTHLFLLHAAAARGDSDGGFLKSLPPEVWQVLQANRYWRAAMKEINGETGNLEDLEITTFSDLLAVSFTAELGAQLLRTHLQNLDVEAREKLQQRMVAYKKEMSSEPRLHICSDKCASLPDGTRTVVLNYLMFQLTFAKVGKKMKLVLIASRIGE